MIRCGHCTAAHATVADVRECAAYFAHVADEAALDARFGPHVDFPDGAAFARIVADEDEFLEGDAAHMAAIATHRDAF